MNNSEEMQEHMKSEHNRVVNIDSLNKDALGYDDTNDDRDNEKENTKRKSETEVEEDEGMFT